MGQQTKSTLKSWFVRGAKPLAAQFADWIDSFRHNDDAIEISEISGLEDALNATASSEDVEAVADQLAAGLIGQDGVDGTIKITKATSPEVGVIIYIYANGAYQEVLKSLYIAP